MNIIIAGGGTGGHLFPGIAIAREFLRRSPDNKITFIGTTKGIENRILPKLGFELKVITVKGFKGKRLLEKIIALCCIPFSFIQSAYYIKKNNADMVIGLGGYISFPAIIAGIMMKIPTAIHEQNSFPGLSNRILGKVADRIFISSKESSHFFKKRKTILSGLPIRKELIQNNSNEKQDLFCILIIGGSQGSFEINRAVINALPELEGIKDRIKFVHQSGEADRETLIAQYKKNGIDAEVFSFIEDIYTFYKNARLVISRSGASTLAELAQCGKASILIPFPYATNNHQEINALEFVEEGASIMINSSRLNGAKLASVIINLESRPEQINKMEKQAKNLSKPKASERIADECYKLTTP
jgi:UDP-N-acetylglucosamine--N-acetylmuramyl-(pentapeptide) pyrophosphoryl-undecaprenol N-acetylglucosamine transferase